MLYPFVMMDVPAGNSLPDPYGGTGQPPYPWRGRITCDPAPGKAGSPDGTSAAATQVERWFTRAAGFNRMVLHYADLAEEAGGVQGFILGSELVGLTRVRSASGVYPAVARLRALAAEVRAILRASTKIVYAADWTEYGAHVLDGGGEVRFPLDPLFADDDIDAVGIDYYPPISDWRDAPNHADLAAARSVYDVDYLRGAAGQRRGVRLVLCHFIRAQCADAPADHRRSLRQAMGLPAKDLVSWWSNRHMERVDGVEIGATAWQPQSKPIWLTEIGIPAVDKGPNGPNVFPDPKSSESAYPPFSRGVRDDLVQARGLEAILSRFDPAQRGFAAEYNPASTSYNGRMVDPDNIFVWAWDARPFPAFPDFDIVWSDSANWETGHWITGRIEGATLDRLIVRILRDFGFVDPGPIPVDGFVDGYVIDRPMSVRGALEPLLRLFGVDAVARGGAIAWQGRGGRAVAHLTKDDLVLGDKEPSLKLTRAQETELPQQVEVGFTEGDTDYRRAAVASRRLSGASRREARADSAVVTRRAEAQRLADTWLQDLWAGREGAEFELSPRRIELEPGDVIAVPTDAGEKLHRIVRIADGATRKLSTRAVEPAVFERPGSFIPRPVKRPPPVPGKPLAVVLDLPVALGDPAALQYVAVAADPWPGAMTIWRSGNGASYAPYRILDLPALIGRTTTAFMPGPLWRWDPRAVLDVTLSSGALSSIDDEAALSGRNLFALQGADGRWEIFSAARAELIGERSYRLSRFLRGLAGSEPQAARTVPAGALLVKLDEAVAPLTTNLQDLGQTWRYRIGPSGRDHADASVAEIVATVPREALRPFAPVHVAAKREAAGIRLAWTRRTRLNGDGWDAIDVPLAEDAESYEIDILDAGAVRRTLTSNAALHPLCRCTGDCRFRRAAIRAQLSRRADERRRRTRLRTARHASGPLTSATSWPGSSRPSRSEKRCALPIEITGTRPAMTWEGVVTTDFSMPFSEPIPMSSTPHLALPLIAAAQAQKHVTHNEALAALDALVQLAVKERGRNAPPASPAEGDRYLVGTDATGAFAGQAGHIALFDLGAWRFFTPHSGWLVYVEAEDLLVLFDGADWKAVGAIPEEIHNLQRLGLGTVADGLNRLSAKLNAALFAALSEAEGGTGDLRFVLNKSAETDVLSQLYQRGFSGRAETGLDRQRRFPHPRLAGWQRMARCAPDRARKRRRIVSLRRRRCAAAEPSRQCRLSREPAPVRRRVARGGQLRLRPLAGRAFAAARSTARPMARSPCPEPSSRSSMSPRP